MAEVKKALAMPRNPLYTVFVDFRAIFISAPRDKVMLPLADVNVAKNVLNLFSGIRIPNAASFSPALCGNHIPETDHKSD